MSVLGAFFAALLSIFEIVVTLYIWVLFIHVVMSWLIAFDILNARSRAVQVVGDVVYRLTEPALKRIRRFLPAMGGIDLSPLALILVIIFLKSFFGYLVLGS